VLAQILKENKIVDAKQREADFNRSILQAKRLAASKNKIDEMIKKEVFSAVSLWCVFYGQFSLELILQAK
jgi:hypothetical protein